MRVILTILWLECPIHTNMSLCGTLRFAAPSHNSSVRRKINSGMKHKVQFISLEEDDKDLIVSFALDDAEMGVISLILLRTLFYEGLMDEEERGVKVSLEGDEMEQEHLNVLKSIKIRAGEIEIKSLFREYQLDISTIEESEMKDMLELLKKQNFDNRFAIHIA